MRRAGESSLRFFGLNRKRVAFWGAVARELPASAQAVSGVP